MDCTQQNHSHKSNNKKLSLLRSTTLLSALSFTLLSCGGGGSSSALPPPPIEKNPCTSNQLQKSGGGCVSAVAVSADNIPGADGLDLTNNGIPELVFIAPINDPTTGIDFNGDGIIDYYLLTDSNGKKSLHTDRPGTSDTVTIITDTNNNPQGFDEGNNKTNTQLKDILANTATPVVSTNFSGKINGVGNKQYQTAPNISINCDASSTCNAISYTINDASNSEPNFNGTGTIILGGSVPAEILLLAKNSNGDSLDGIYTLKFIARSASNQLSAVQTEVFEINSTACATLPTAALNLTANTPSNIENATKNKFGITANFIDASTNTFTLDGSASNTTDVNRTITNFTWKQVPSGDEERLTAISSSTNNAVQTFTIPKRITTLNYLFSVTDSFGCTASTTATVYVMKNPNSAFFIDATSTATSSTPGARETPFKTVQAAIQKNIANATSFDLYIIAKDNNSNYIEPPLIIADGISLFGGFDTNWNRDVVRNKTKILIRKDITNDPHLRAIDFQNINSDTWLTGFEITALLDPVTATSESDIFAVHATGELNNTATLTIQHNSINAGDALDGNAVGTGSSYGVYVSTVADTQIELNTISSGQGGSGINGANGMQGIQGSPGLPGDIGITGGIPLPPRAFGGLGGTGGIGGEIRNPVTPNSEGLNGGYGGYILPDASRDNGEKGFGLCAGLGGLSQIAQLPVPSTANAEPILLPGKLNCPTIEKLTSASNLVAGQSIGIFNLSNYSPSNGGNGTIGQDGTRGGSGGSGGGFIQPDLAIVNNGSGGGGGGAAGFGGKFGEAGFGGGISLSLFINNTTATIKNNFLTSNSGGNAGNGGLGGLGGIGGIGGKGGVTTISGNGSDGQDGNPGGNGGDASGGGGGPSIGIYFNSTNAPTITKNTITTGNGGNGGNARHGAAGDGGVSYGLYAGNGSVTPTPTGNTITAGQPGAGGIINQDTTTNTPGTGAPGSIGEAGIQNF